jgi:hypothetical protein
MKRAILLLSMGVLATAVAGAAQADLDTFPVGSTTMIYQMTAEDMDEPQLLELTVVVRGDGLFTVRMVTEATGDEDQLAGFGFLFGATSLAYGGQRDVSYNSLQALIDQRSRLEEGQEYLLPGGASFTGISGVTIAGVWSLEGSFVDPDQEDTQMTVAFGLSHPVFISPRVVVEELREGAWIEVFRLELTSYAYSEEEA